jgi:hypothetical protein
VSALDLSVVIPVYNNSGTLPELVDRLVRVIEGLGISFEVIFVDDDSMDASREIIRDRAACDGRIRLCSLAANFGSQAALCAGFELVRGKRTICMDADLENLPEDIPALLHALDSGFELACGVRALRRDAWTSRRLPSALLNWYARRRLNTPVRDLWCGMRAMDSRVIRGLSAEGERRRSLTPLFLSRAKSVVEVPIRHDPAKEGSHYSLLALTAIAIDFVIGTARRPFLTASLVAASTAACAVAALFGALVLHSTTLAITVLVVLVGAAVASLVALVGDYVQRLYELQPGKPLYRVRESDASQQALVTPLPAEKKVRTI